MLAKILTLQSTGPTASFAGLRPVIFNVGRLPCLCNQPPQELRAHVVQSQCARLWIARLFKHFGQRQQPTIFVVLVTFGVDMV